MRTSYRKLAVPGPTLVARGVVILCMMLGLCAFAGAQQGKSAPAKSDLTGHYEGAAKNGAGEVITVTFDLTEKDGAMSGMIHSSHGDFTVTGGSHHGEEVSLEFDAGGPVGTISLKISKDKLAGTWSAGEDGGPVEVKKAAAQEEAPKGKS